MRSSRPPHAEQGFALVAVMVVALMVTVMVSITATLSLSAYRTTRTESQKGQAFFAAQTGLERATARAKELDLVASAGLPRSVNTHVLAAQWLADRLGLSATLPGGSYTVTTSVAAGATASDPALLTLTSQGDDPSTRGTRRLQVTFPVKVLQRDQVFGPMIGAAPAALTVTASSSINGSAPIAGESGGLGTIHNLACHTTFAGAASCTRSQSSPPQYTLQYAGNVPSTFKPGTTLRPTSVPGTNQTSEERYMVESVDASGKVVLNVISDYIRIGDMNSTDSVRRTIPASGNFPMRELTGIPALLLPPGASFSSVSNNVRDACDTSECSHYTMPPADLFKSIMGETEANTRTLFQQLGAGGSAMYNTSGTAPCTPAVQWMAMGTAASKTANLNECANPQLVVLDARNVNELTIDMGAQASFRGFLYILGKGGDAVKVTSNVGFAGAVIVDNGSGGFSMAGTGNFNTDCSVPLGENKRPKLCYDSDIMTEVRTSLINDVLALRDIDLTLNSQNWREIAND